MFCLVRLPKGEPALKVEDRLDQIIQYMKDTLETEHVRCYHCFNFSGVILRFWHNSYTEATSAINALQYKAGLIASSLSVMVLNFDAKPDENIDVQVSISSDRFLSPCPNGKTPPTVKDEYEMIDNALKALMDLPKGKYTAYATLGIMDKTFHLEGMTFKELEVWLDMRKQIQSKRLAVNLLTRSDSVGEDFKSLSSAQPPQPDGLMKQLNDAWVAEDGHLKDNDAGRYEILEPIRGPLRVIMQELSQIEHRNYLDDVLSMVIAPLTTYLHCIYGPGNNRDPMKIKEMLADSAFFLRQLRLLMQPYAHDIGFFFYNALPTQELCDVPSMLAAGMSAFLVLIDKLYCLPDKNRTPERRSAYLISPTFAAETQGRQLFYNMIWNENANNPHFRLKVISVPAKRLFESSVCPILAHEAAHYSGSILRKRRERSRYFAKTIAELVANKLTDEWEDRYTKIIEDQIMLPSTTKDSQNEERDFYQARIMDKIVYDLQSCMLQTSRYASLVRDFEEAFEEKHRHEGRADRARAVKRHMALLETSIRYLLTNAHRLEGIERIVLRVGSLFSECYADALMIHVLGLSVDDYIDYHVDAHVKFKNGEYNYDQVDRMLAVMQAMGWPLNSVYKDDKEKELLEVINDEEKKFYVQKHIRHLRTYLEECIKGFKDQLDPEDKDLKLIQRTYSSFKENQFDVMIDCFQQLDEKLEAHNQSAIEWLWRGGDEL
jgi:hypothetical protein